jgi:hypothetical protein
MKRSISNTDDLQLIKIRKIDNDCKYLVISVPINKHSISQIIEYAWEQYERFKRIRVSITYD